jgi:tetratricopeptide (TPR) repeat protein
MFPRGAPPMTLRSLSFWVAGARPLHERALAIREKALGPEHPHTAASLNNLGLLLRDQGDYAGARPLFERAMAICDKALGPEHPDTARVCGNLARLRLLGDPSEARALGTRALAALDKAPGRDRASASAVGGARGLRCNRRIKKAPGVPGLPKGEFMRTI